MDKNKDPRELVVQLLKRSGCAVQVASIIEDKWGIFSWGWNHSGRDGLGQHAEAHAFDRANYDRLEGATIYVAARRNRNGRVVTARPCLNCDGLITLYNLGKVIYRDGEGRWIYD